MAAHETQQGFGQVEEFNIAQPQRFAVLAQGDHLARKGQAGVRIGRLFGHRQPLVLHRQRQPGRAGGEAHLRPVIPGHGRAAPVAPAVIGPVEVADWIA